MTGYTSNQTCRVPLLRYMTIARSVRNHFFMNTGESRGVESIPACSCWSPILPPADRCVYMYSAKYSRSVTFFWCSAGADWALNEYVRLLRSLYWTVLSQQTPQSWANRKTSIINASGLMLNVITITVSKVTSHCAGTVQMRKRVRKRDKKVRRDVI